MGRSTKLDLEQGEKPFKKDPPALWFIGRWADKKTVNWAIVQVQFFSEHPPRREFFERHLDAFAWNEQVLPIYEWNGLIYVAAVNPAAIADLMPQWPANWVLLQSEAGPLQQLWQSWTRKIAAPATAFAGANEDSALDSTQPRIQLSENFNESFGKESTPSAPTPPLGSLRSLAANKQTPAESEGMDFNPDDLLASVASSAKNSKQDAKNISNHELDLSEGFPEVPSEDEGLEVVLSEDSNLSADSGADVAMPEGLQVIVPPPPPPDEFSEPTPATAAAPPDTLSSLSRPKIPLPDLSKADPGISPVLPTPRKAPSSVAATPAAPATPSKPATTAASVGPENSIGHFHGIKISATTQGILNTLPEDYTQAILAAKAGNSLRVVAWSENVKKADDAEMDYSLGTPSPFRICVRTEKAYHGYLVNSPYLDHFFQQWHGGVYPETLTVIPLINETQLMGFLICFGNFRVARKSGLVAIERLAQNLIESWALPAPAKAG